MGRTCPEPLMEVLWYPSCPFHLSHFLPPQTVPDIVTALVISHIHYCLTVYGNGTAKNLASIQKILNFAARVTSDRRKYDHVSDVRDALGWLDSSQLLHHQSLTLLHKIIQTGEPESIASQIRSNRDDPVHVRTTRQDHLLQLPKICTEAGRRRFLYWVVQRYNALPAEIRELRITRFRTRLRSHLRDLGNS